MKLKIVLVFIVVLCTLFSLPVAKASAATSSDWIAGRIIDDSVFTNQNSMSIADIQNFLNQKVGTNNYGTPGICDTNGTKTSELGGGTRAQYGASRGSPAPFTCLKDYYEVPKISPGPGIPASNYGGQAIPAGAKSAANLIYDAAQDYHISPKVLLVTIQKESAGPLITDDWPLQSQYTYAMGAHCPDSGPGGSANCDANYSGFSIQIAESAALLRYYLDNMSQPWWPYKKVGTNTIQYSPNTACGSSAVSITSSATAALYTYTPYQPNAAALNNLYGTGDGCSAYGNRNFWRMYSDWFGSTVGDLVRTAGDATVYLISGDNKYPISDGSVLADFSSLGPIRFVGDDYTNTKTTGPVLGHMVGASSGTLYFVNAGIKLPFSSCGMVADFGYSCGQVITLTDGQMSLLYNGPGLTKIYKTTSGKTFYIQAGTKHEVFDQQSLTGSGITGAANTLLEPGLAYLGYGLPIIRDQTIAVSRFNDYAYYYENNVFNYLSPELLQSLAFKNIVQASFEDGSIPFIRRNMNFNGFIKNTSSTQYFVLDKFGKAILDTPSDWSASFGVVSDVLLSLMPNSTQPITNHLIKSLDNGTVYYATAGSKRPLSSWSDLLSMQASPLIVNTLSSTTINSMTTGNRILGPGQLVKYSTSSTVYLVDGTSSLVPVSTFTVPLELGLGKNLSTIDPALLDSYSKASAVQTDKVQCNGKNYLGSGGVLHEVTSSMQANYGLTYVPLDSLTCLNTSTVAAPLDRFLHVPDSTIFYIEAGLKHPITSYAKYLSLGGNSTNTVSVSNYAAGQIPTGDPAI